MNPSSGPSPANLSSSSKANFLKNLGTMDSLTPARPMKYPYTYTAKIAQFPFKFYWQHSWLFKWMMISSILVTPVFYKIEKMATSPENKAKWDEIHRKEFYGENHH